MSLKYLAIAANLCLAPALIGCSSFSGKKETETTLWNGTDKEVHSIWTGVDDKSVNSASYEILPGEGSVDAGYVKLSLANVGWGGMGFTWLADFYKDSSGINASKYQSLAFDMRTAGTILPRANAFAISTSSDNLNWGGEVKIAGYTSSELLDGTWHTVSIPIDQLEKESKKGHTIDPRQLKTILFSVWTKDYVDFDLEIDNIRLIK